MKKMSGVLLFACALLLSGAAWAQYRCGKVYQDTPCEGQGKSGGAITSSSAYEARPNAASTSGKDEYCTRRGLAAQKIKWGRESGLTAETQLSSTSDPEEKRLISDVYRRAGNSVDVRNAVEADCLAERERAAQAAALIAAANKLQVNSTATSQTSSSPSTVTTTQKQDTGGSTEQAAAQSRCRSLNAQRDGIVGQQRAGGSATHMESLNRQRQQIDKNIRDAGC